MNTKGALDLEERENGSRLVYIEQLIRLKANTSARLLMKLSISSGKITLGREMDS
jgi:hypothetical protein